MGPRLGRKAAEEVTFCIRCFVVNLRHETTTTLPITADFAARSFLLLIRNSDRRAAYYPTGAEIARALNKR